MSADELGDSRALVEKLKLTFPLASDPQLAAIRAFGVEMQGRGIAVPATFVLRPGDGRVVYRYIGETMMDRPAVDAILSALDQRAK